MAEKADVVEEEVVVEPEKETAEKQAEETTDGDAQAMATILSAVKENPALASDPEIAKVMEMVDGKDVKTAKDKTDKKETKETDSKTDSKKEEGGKDDDSEEGAVTESAFFKKGKEKEEKKIEIENIDDATKHIKEKYSIDDVDTFFKSVDKWRTSAQEKEKVQDKLEGIQSAFDEMPEQLFNAFNSWANGKDWTKDVNNAGILDYKTDFEDYEEYDIVNHYFPDEYEEDDFDDDNKDATVKRALKLAKAQYESEKEAFEEARAGYKDKAEKHKKLIKDSVTDSVQKLKEEFPDFGKEALKKVKDTMSSGDLTSLFFTKAGAYSDDAAVKIALMLFGKDEIVKANSRSKKSQEVLKKTVARGSEKPMVKTSQSQQTQIPDEVTGIFKDVFVKNHY